MTISLFTLLVTTLFLHWIPSACSDEEPIVLDPTVCNLQRWENARIETYFGNGTPPFKTTVYSEPQVVWNGTHWVRYELEQIDGSTAVAMTPSCTYIIGEDTIQLYDANFTALHADEMSWIVEQYSGLLNQWLPKTIGAVYVTHNSTHAWQKWMFTDGSERTVYISGDNKQTVTFVPKSLADYRLVWQFTDVNATRIVYENGTSFELEEGCSVETTSFCFNGLAFYENASPSLLVDHHEIAASYHREFRLHCTELGFANMELVYGNWTLSAGEALVVDPRTAADSEASLDGTIYRWGTTYPPTNSAILQDFVYVGQRYIEPYYYMYRGYVSFDTSYIRDYAVISNATLMLKTAANYSAVDFTSCVMGGAQPIYGDALEVEDWDCYCAEVASWPTGAYAADNTYVNITVPIDQINATGRTQFELRSDREGTLPGNGEYPEYVIFYAAEFAGSEPQLEVTWMPQMEYVHGAYWYYWHHSSNKVAIVLFGGRAYSDRVKVLSIFEQDQYGQKEKFVQDLHSSGFDVVSPKNLSQPEPILEDYIEYGYLGIEVWIYNATMWLLNEKGYDHVFLFGFSAGGVAAGWEIQKDYAYVYSGAVIASAPVAVEWLTYSIYQSAYYAGRVQTCTAFICGEEDIHPYFGDLYEDVSIYFNNTNAHKQWHKWNGGHDIFPNTCLTHPDETVSDAVIDWFASHSGPLGDPSFEERLRTVYGSPHWETSTPGWRSVLGDINGDRICNMIDLFLVQKAFGAESGNRTYSWLCDLNGDGTITMLDLYMVSKDFGDDQWGVQGAYSWYVNGTSASGSYYMWQWLNHSLRELKGKKITYGFQFKPQTLPTNGFVEAMIYYYDSAGDRYIFGGRIYYNQTRWYTASVTMPIVFPESTTTIKLMIRWNPDFRAWVDNATLTILP